MSWEVLTMRSVTSFFNPALARSDLRRHWPILFLYTAIWLVALPVQLYLRHIAEGASYGTRTVSEVCQGTYSMGVIMAFVFGGVLAMALYSYLMNGRSVGLIHSLPLKRQTLFFTQLLTGFAMLTAGNLLVVLVSPLENGGWQALGIYAAVAVAIIALACLLCIRRRSELSGDVAAFPWMRPVLRYGVGCMGGLALGMILYSVTFGLARSNDIRAYLPGMLLCVVLMTLVCSFGMSMLLGKSLKIFRRTWKGTVLLAALLAAVCVCVRMDVAGVERRVPKTDEIESVTAQCRNIQPFTATSGDTETIEAIRAIHRAILEQVEDGDVDLDGTPLIEDGQYIWIRLKYTLTDGSTLERGYNVPVRRASALYTAINQMMSTPLARQELAISGTADADSAPLGGSIYSVDTGDVRNLTAVEAQMLYQAAQQDVAEGRVISDILSDTGYSPLQVDITGNDWDCVLNLDNFTDDAHTLELVNRFLSGGDGEGGE